MKPTKPLVHLEDVKNNMHGLLEEISQNGYANAESMRQSKDTITNEYEFDNGEEYQSTIQVSREDRSAGTLMVAGDICYHGAKVEEHKWWQFWKIGHTPISYESFTFLPDGRIEHWHQHDSKKVK